jgi:hypothetical protein
MPNVSDQIKAAPLWKKIVGVVLAGAVIFLALEVRSCSRAKYKVEYYKGVAAEQAKATADAQDIIRALEKRRIQDKKDYDEAIGIANGNIDSLNTVIAGLDKDISERNGTIAKQKDELALATTDAARVKIQAGIISGLELNIKDLWAARDKDAEKIFNLTTKYEAATVRISNLEADISKLERDVIKPLIAERDTLLKLNKNLQTQVSWGKGMGTAKTVLIAAAVGYVALKK